MEKWARGDRAEEPKTPVADVEHPEAEPAETEHPAEKEEEAPRTPARAREESPPAQRETRAERSRSPVRHRAEPPPREYVPYDQVHIALSTSSVIRICLRTRTERRHPLGCQRLRPSLPGCLQISRPIRRLARG